MTTKDPVSKHEVLDLIREERSALQAVLDGLGEDQMMRPALEHGLSVKDTLAHIAVWEQRMIQWLDESYRGEVPQRPAPGMTWDDLDRLNEQTYLANKDRPLAEVLAEFDQSYRRAWQAVERMTEQDLFDGARFAWREGDPAWRMVAANTWWHYREHREEIEHRLTGDA